MIPANCPALMSSAGSSNWAFYHKSIGNTGAVFLNTTNATASIPHKTTHNNTNLTPSRWKVTVTPFYLN